MIGNDIVDLKYSSTNWKRSRFLDKVFTQKEQVLIHASENQHQMLWLLWSMKEAAYKVHVQQFGERFFNPKKLRCELISEENGRVKIGENSYYTDSTITKDYVYSIAKQDYFEKVTTSIFQTENSSHKHQSATVKAKILKSISETQDLDLNALNIKKTDIGIPQIYNSFNQVPVSISLTHCGRFFGYAY